MRLLHWDLDSGSWIWIHYLSNLDICFSSGVNSTLTISTILKLQKAEHMEVIALFPCMYATPRFYLAPAWGGGEILVFLHDCKIKSESGMGTRLGVILQLSSLHSTLNLMHSWSKSKLVIAEDVAIALGNFYWGLSSRWYNEQLKKWLSMMSCYQT